MYRSWFATRLLGPVEASHHPIGVITVVAVITLVVLVRGVLRRLPPRLDLARHTSSACCSRFFFFAFFFSASFTDFCFSAEARLFSRSTSSSFTGGFEDQKSIVP